MLWNSDFPTGNKCLCAQKMVEVMMFAQHYLPFACHSRQLQPDSFLQYSLHWKWMPLFLSKCTLKTLGMHVNLSHIFFTVFYSVSCACLGWGTRRKFQYICMCTTPFKHCSLTFPMFSVSWSFVNIMEWGRSSSDTFCSFCMAVCSTSFKIVNMSQFTKVILSFVAWAKSLHREQVLFLTPILKQSLSCVMCLYYTHCMFKTSPYAVKR